jgi:hypothetical protein
MTKKQSHSYSNPWPLLILLADRFFYQYIINPYCNCKAQTPETNQVYEYADRFRTFLLAGADNVQETLPPNGEGTLTCAVVNIHQL